MKWFSSRRSTGLTVQYDPIEAVEWRRQLRRFKEREDYEAKHPHTVVIGTHLYGAMEIEDYLGLFSEEKS